MRSRWKTLSFSLMLAGFAGVGVELAARAVLALRLGPAVLVYGTPFDRQVLRPQALLDRPWHERLALPERRQRRVGIGDAGYLKYHPNQRKFGWDPDGNRYRVGINRRGFRGPDFETRKAPGVVRVVALGASSTFGYHDRDRETYPYYLERQLNAAMARDRPGGEPVSFEVINLGIPHLNSANIVSLVRAEALGFAPDIITLYEGINDTRRIAPPALQKLLFALSHRLVLAQLGQQVVTRHFTSFSADDLERYLPGKRESFVRNLREIRELCQGAGIRFIAISQQAKSNAIPSDRISKVTYEQEVQFVQSRLVSGERISLDEMLFLIHADIMDGLREWVIEEGVEFADGIRALDERGKRDTLLSWVHLSAEGNRILAEMLAKVILAGHRVDE